MLYGKQMLRFARLEATKKLRALPLALVCAGALPIIFSSCTAKPPHDTAVMIIENSPTNLDPRVGTDAQSERIYKLLFDALLLRDENFNVQPGLAERWEIPDPLTYVFHLRTGVRFHDGTPLTSADVKYTLDSMLSGKLRTPKATTYKFIDRVDAPDEATVVIHLKEPFAALLWNLSAGAFGIVPRGAGEDFGRHPIGSGPFRFVSAAQDRDVVVERNNAYWNGPPRIRRVRFVVVPDATTRALELRRGSADAAINALSSDMVLTLQRNSSLVIQRAPGTIYSYLALNLRDPILKDIRVRQALAYALDREPIIHYLWRDMARPASSVLPTQHWAYNPEAPVYTHDPARARALLDEAGYRPKPDGIRFHLVMKTSTEESSRLLAAVLQQQFRDVGVALDIRSFEFATFYADVTRGAFQLYSLRWIGGNEDPDMFEHVFESTATPPKRANRSFYSNSEVDRLIADARRSVDQTKRAEDYRRVQYLVGTELPYINLWYLENVLVHSKRLTNVRLSSSGDYDFLKTAELVD